MTFHHFDEVLRHRAHEKGEAPAYLFLADGENESARLSYAELDRKARSVGAHLQALGAAGERALLLFPPGLDFAVAFFGCLYAGCIAVPAHPPRLRRTARRTGNNQLTAIARDAAPRVILTLGAIGDGAEEIVGQLPELAGVHWLAVDRLADVSGEWRQPELSDIESETFVDHHDMATGGPEFSSLFAACDGGIYISHDFGKCWKYHSHGLDVSQFYDLAISPHNHDVLGGGTQDLGTWIRTARG